MASRSTTSCMPCRTRKVKCDGQLERCGPCRRARANLHCTFDPSAYIEAKPQRHSLQRGAACAPCRKKKKKCNGARPYCDVCCKAEEEHQCRYDDRSGPYEIHSKTRPLRWIVSAADKPNVLNDKPHVMRPLESDVVPLSKALVSRSSRYLEYSYYPPETTSFYDITYVFNPIWNLTQGGLFNGPVPTNPYMFSLSEVSLTDMDMTFRLIFLSHRVEIGFQFTKAKEEAVIFGDLSNTVIHPFFIHFAHILGCNLYQERKREYSFLYSMCIYLQRTKEALTSMRAEDDPLSYAQACYFMALLCAYNCQVVSGRQYFAKVVQTVERYDIRFVSRSESGNRSLSSSSLEEHLERIVFLVQVIYFQSLSVPIMSEWEDFCYGLQQQFTNELPGTYFAAWKTCPMVSRVQAMVASKSAMILVNSYELDGVSISWLSSCLAWLRSVTSYVDVVVIRLAEFQSSDDHTTHATYKFLLYDCCIYWASLDQVNRILQDQRQYLYLQSIQECRLACSKVLNTVTNATANDIELADFEYMTLLFHTYYSQLFNDGQSKPSGVVAVSTSKRQVKPGSIFSYMTILLSGYYRDKLASVRLDL